MVMFINHLGWLAAIPAAGAIFIPYFAVVFANGGREPNNTRGFMEYHPTLPAPRDPAAPPTENGHRPAGPDRRQRPTDSPVQPPSRDLVAIGS